jgi:hypothetical protein
VFYSDNRKEENLYLRILALDFSTGKLAWYYQEIPEDMWDWEIDADFSSSTGSARTDAKADRHMNKGGYAFVLDRTNGDLQGTYPFADHITGSNRSTQQGELVGRLDRHLGLRTRLICPSNLGAKKAGTNRILAAYGPTLRADSGNVQRHRAAQTERRIGRPRRWYLDHEASARQRDRYSHLDALDPVTGKKVWSYPYKYELLASVSRHCWRPGVLRGMNEGFYFCLDAKTARNSGASRRARRIAEDPSHTGLEPPILRDSDRSAPRRVNISMVCVAPKPPAGGGVRASGLRACREDAR